MASDPTPETAGLGAPGRDGAGRFWPAWAAVLGIAVGATLLACSPPRPRSVLLVVVDTLRADHLGLHGHHRPTTPGLDEWAREAAVFDQAQATSSWTLPTFGSLLTGRLPAVHRAGARPTREGGRMSRRLDPDLPTLAEVLAGAGLSTGAVVNNPWLRPRFGLDRGFETYDHARADNHRHRRADASVDAALEWIGERREEPFFLLLHLFDPHMTYDPPPPVRGRFTAGIEASISLPVEGPRRLHRLASELSAVERELIAAAYDEEIAFVDRELARLFRELRRDGLWERLLVVLTSDHGEELFDHGGFEHGHTVYQELLRVPLLVWGPGVEARRLSEPVSLVDLPATIAEAVGATPPPQQDGVSLWPALSRGRSLPRRVLVAEGTLYGPERKAAILWPWKLTRMDGRARRLHHLAADPGERVDLLREELPGGEAPPASVVVRLEETLAGLRALGGAADPDLRELDPETLEELRSLGYVEGDGP